MPCFIAVMRCGWAGISAGGEVVHHALHAWVDRHVQIGNQHQELNQLLPLAAGGDQIWIGRGWSDRRILQGDLRMQYVVLDRLHQLRKD